MENTDGFLVRLGLSKSEIGVYKAGLALGPALVRDIAKKANISRTLIYHVLQSLQERGLASKIGKQTKQVITMASPERLRNIITRQREELTTLEKQLPAIEAELGSLTAPKTTETSVRFYQGLEAMKTVAMEALNTKEKKIFALVPIQNILGVFDETFLTSWARVREFRQIVSKSIWTTSEVPSYVKSHFQELHIAPQGMNFPTTTIVYDDTVIVFSSPASLFAFVVESKEFADTLKAVFDQLWKYTTDTPYTKV